MNKLIIRRPVYGLVIFGVVCLAFALLGCKEGSKPKEKGSWDKQWEARLNTWDQKSAKWGREITKLNAQLARLEGELGKAGVQVKPLPARSVPTAARVVVPVAKRPLPRLQKFPLGRPVVRLPKPASRQALAPASRPATQPVLGRPTSRPGSQPTSRPVIPTAVVQPSSRTLVVPKAPVVPTPPRARKVVRRRPAPPVVREPGHRKATRRVPPEGHRSQPRARRHSVNTMLRIARVRSLRRQIEALRKKVRWFQLGKVELGHLKRLEQGMLRQSTWKKKKRSAGVWELANQARYGHLSDYDWRDGDRYMTNYYLKDYMVLEVAFSSKQKLVDANLRSCEGGGKRGFASLVAGAGKVGEVASLVHTSPSIKAWSWSPLALVNRVNALRAYGKDLILQGMEHYLKIVHRHRVCRHQYDLDEQRILPLLRLLFVRKAGAAPLLAWKIGRPDVLQPANDKSFPLFPLALADDLPLLLVGGYTRVGEPVESMAVHLRDARSHGALSTKALRPAGTMPGIVDALVNSQPWKKLMSGAVQQRKATKESRARSIRGAAFQEYHKVILRAQAISTAQREKLQKSVPAVANAKKAKASLFKLLRSEQVWRKMVASAAQ